MAAGDAEQVALIVEYQRRITVANEFAAQLPEQIARIVDASWWIERGTPDIEQWADWEIRKDGFLNEIRKRWRVLDAPFRPAETAEAQAFTPESQITDTVADIRVQADRVTIEFPEKREDFRELVKLQLGYTWTGSSWQRRITQFNGPRRAPRRRGRAPHPAPGRARAPARQGCRRAVA